MESNYQLHLGDCLEVMRGMADKSVDAVITDPPYSSGGMFRSDRSVAPSKKYIQTTSVNTCKNEFSGDNRDQRAFLAWSSMWMSQMYRVSGDGAVLLCFTDWRQLPTMTDAVQCGGWIWRNIVTWWKPGCRMQKGRPSLSAEYCIYATKGKPKDGERAIQNVQSFAPVPGKDKEHQSEKPSELISTLLQCTTEGCTILDPFMGSGTTGVACMETGRKFIGIELDPEYFEIAEKRIYEATRQQKLF
jgi:site-specific DNA-methyltransferase (adenine-specific)